MVALSLVFAFLSLAFAIAYTLSDKSDTVNIGKNLVPYKDIFRYCMFICLLITSLQFLVDYGTGNLVLVVVMGLMISLLMFILLLDLVMVAIPAIVNWRRKRM